MAFALRNRRRGAASLLRECRAAAAVPAPSLQAGGFALAPFFAGSADTPVRQRSAVGRCAARPAVLSSCVSPRCWHGVPRPRGSVPAGSHPPAGTAIAPLPFQLSRPSSAPCSAFPGAGGRLPSLLFAHFSPSAPEMILGGGPGHGCCARLRPSVSLCHPGAPPMSFSFLQESQTDPRDGVMDAPVPARCCGCWPGEGAGSLPGLLPCAPALRAPPDPRGFANCPAVAGGGGAELLRRCAPGGGWCWAGRSLGQRLGRSQQ